MMHLFDQVAGTAGTHADPDPGYADALAAHVTYCTGREWVACGSCRVALVDDPRIRMTCTEGTLAEGGQRWRCWLKDSAVEVTAANPLIAFGRFATALYRASTTVVH